MFSLIITIVAIALVAALALATIYYGGTAFNKGASTAAATRAISQGQQIQGAMDLYRADFGEWPTKEQILGANARGFVYLRSWPEGPAQTAALGDSFAVAQAMAQAAPGGGSSAPAGKAWLVPSSPVQPTAVLSDSVSRDVCAQINRLSRGDNGIANTVSSSYATQCFSPDGVRYVVVVTKAGLADLDAGLNDLGLGLRPDGSERIKVTGTALNTGNPTDPVWVSPPDATGNEGNEGNGGNGGNGGSDPLPGSTLSVGPSSALLIGPHGYDDPDSARQVAFSLTNTGAAPVQIMGTLAGVFDVRGDCSANPVLNQGETCTGTLELSRGMPPGLYEATVIVFLDDGTQGQFGVTATLLPPGVLSPEATSVDFGVNLLALSGPVKRTVTLTNTGGSAAKIMQPIFLSGPFTVEGSCTLPGAILAAGQSCEVTLVFDRTKALAEGGESGNTAEGNVGVRVDSGFSSVSATGTL